MHIIKQQAEVNNAQESTVTNKRLLVIVPDP